VGKRKWIELFIKLSKFTITSLQFDCIIDYILYRALEAACAAYASKFVIITLRYITLVQKYFVKFFHVLTFCIKAQHTVGPTMKTLQYARLSSAWLNTRNHLYGGKHDVK